MDHRWALVHLFELGLHVMLRGGLAVSEQMIVREAPTREALLADLEGCVDLRRLVPGRDTTPALYIAEIVDLDFGPGVGVKHTVQRMERWPEQLPLRSPSASEPSRSGSLPTHRRRPTHTPRRAGGDSGGRP